MVARDLLHLILDAREEGYSICKATKFTSSLNTIPINPFPIYSRAQYTHKNCTKDTLPNRLVNCFLQLRSIFTHNSITEMTYILYEKNVVSSDKVIKVFTKCEM